MTSRMASILLALVVLAASCNFASEANARVRHSKAHHHLARHLHVGAARSGDTASLGCLTPSARALIGRIEARFGQMRIASTCRPGATVRDTGRPSRHASGNAIDFFADGRKGAVVGWLVANNVWGGTMTYSNSDHIHVDIGPRWVSLAGAYAYANTGHGSKHVRKLSRHKRAA